MAASHAPGERRRQILTQFFQGIGQIARLTGLLAVRRFLSGRRLAVQSVDDAAVVVGSDQFAEEIGVLFRMVSGRTPGFAL
jgi:hypothetical protein